MCLVSKSQVPKTIFSNRQLLQNIKSDVPNIPSAEYVHYLQPNTQPKLVENNVVPPSTVSSFTPMTTTSVVPDSLSDDNISSKYTTSSVPASRAPAKKAPTKKKRIRKRKKLPPGLTATNRERLFIKHDYHDHANDTPKDVIPPPDTNGGSTPSSGHRSRRFQSKKKERSSSYNHPGDAPPANASFPIKLHAILDHLSSDPKASDIISWQPHGRAFVIRDKLRFIKEVMPKYFNQTRFTSFQRQLNLYGFLRLSRAKDRGAYYHEMFLKGREWLCQNIFRVKSKGVGLKAAGDPEGEPDFWSMPFVKSTDNTEQQADTQTAEPTIHDAITATHEVMSDSTRYYNDPSSTSNGRPPANHGVSCPQYHNLLHQPEGNNEREQPLPLITESMGSFDSSFDPQPLYNRQHPLRGSVSSLSSMEDIVFKDDDNENNQGIDDLIVDILLPSSNDEVSGEAVTDVTTSDINPLPTTTMTSHTVATPTLGNNQGYHDDTSEGGNLSFIGGLPPSYECFIPPTYPIPINGGDRGGCSIGTRDVVAQQPSLSGDFSFFNPVTAYGLLSVEDKVVDDDSVLFRSRFEMLAS